MTCFDCGTTLSMGARGRGLQRCAACAGARRRQLRVERDRAKAEARRGRPSARPSGLPVATGHKAPTVALGGRLLDLLKTKGSATARQLSAETGAPPRRVRYALEVVHETGVCRLLSYTVGGSRGRPGTWFAIDPARTPAQEAA